MKANKISHDKSRRAQGKREERNVFLSAPCAPFNQLVDFIKTLPKKEKQQLINILQHEEPDAIPEWQKQEVRKRIKKYNKHPELMVDEK